MNRLSLIVGIVSLLFTTNLTAQQNSVLAEGEWYKLAINETGIYKIDRSFLSDIGIDVESIDPRTIKIYGNPGGMLPQPNSADRPIDLSENSIKVTGENDGSFDAGDLILFYAQGPDSYSYNESGTLTFEKNIYDRQNYYFITVDGDNGKRLTNSDNLGDGFTKVTAYDDFQHHELSQTNFLISGREWYGEKFDLETQYTIDFDFPGVVAGSDIKITSNVMAQSFAASNFNLTLNGNTVGAQTVASVPNYNQQAFRYSVKGKETTNTFTINSDQIDDDVLKLTYDYIKNSSGQSIGFLDEILIEVKRSLRWRGSTFVFRSLESTDNGSSTFQISNSDNSISIWNVTDPTTPKNQTYSIGSGNAIFGTSTTELQEFVVYKNESAQTPEFIDQVSNQNLRGLTVPDLLIVSHPEFRSQAQRLASFRASHDGLSSKVVTTEEIYNEFSSGRQDVTAIRDFVKHLYDKSNKLKYLLLFGRGSYDYLDIITNNTNYVPIYESRNSLHPLQTYGSDDYYGFLEDEEGEWTEDSSGDHTLEIGVGRLPITSLEEATDIVDKLIDYSTNTKNYGSWRNVVSFVADDGDGNLHQRQSDQLTQLVDTTFQSFNPDKLFLDTYEQISRPGGEVSPAASEALNNTIDKGALIVNFTGHGGESGWMQEQVLDIVMIEAWDNDNKLPLFVTSTCEFSRHDDPRRISGGELVVMNPEGGGIGIVSTCRPVNSSSNFELNKAFYNTVFNQNGNTYLRLGDIFKETKNNNNVNQIGNRNFALLGDPSLRLSYPEKQLVINSIENNGIASDTVSALSKVTVKGVVTEDASFNGTLYATIYDKESSFVTLGNENSPFNYYAKENIIFKGQATISNGQFQFEFIVPKNISYLIDEGKISLYAVNSSKTSDANGSRYISVGGSNPAPSTDNIGPNIELYLGDSTNNSLNDIASNTSLFVYLQDDSGINISGYGVGNSLIAILDDSIVYNLNEYYESSLNTYQKGWVDFPLLDLKKGKHTLMLKAWDTFNNSSEESITFNVLDPNQLSISQLLNHPNPFSENTTFLFQHNRAGEDLDIELDIINMTGGVVQKHRFYIEDSSSNVNLGSWNGTNSGGEKLRAGLYLYKLKVRSKKDGATQESHQRLVLIK